MYQRIITGIFFLALSISGYGQVKFSDNPEEFFGQAGDYMKNTKKEECIKAFDTFSAAWNSISPETKKTIAVTSQQMAKRKLYSTPHFADFFTAIGSAVQIRNAGPQLDSFLYVSQKALETFDNKQIREYFNTTRLFFEKYRLYSSSYNQLYVEGGSFKFKFIEEAPVANYDVYETPSEEAEEELTDGWGDPNDHFDDWDNPEQVEDSWDTGWDDSGWGDDTEDSGWGTEAETSFDENPAVSQDQNVFGYGYVAPIQPTIFGPVIELENVDLIFVTQHDSSRIKQTKGSLMLKDGVFVGDGGKFDWSNLGLTPEDCFVELHGYNFDVKSPKLTAEPVDLHYPTKTDSIVEGVFDYQSKKFHNVNDADYPRFKSFASNIPVKGLGNDIEYYGGLSIAGRKIYSSSIDEGKSKILIKRNGEVKVKAIANRFELGDSLLAGDIATIVIYQGKDSIYHPGTIFNYKNPEKTLRLTKTSAYRLTPFTDSYHNMDIVVDALIWNLDSSNIEFRITNAPSELSAKFESNEYFDAGDYSRLQGIYRFHPLQMIVGYAETLKPKNDTIYPPFYASDVAKKYSIEEKTLKGAMVVLMRGGYIDFNNRNGEIKLRKKAIHFVMARRDKKDYDNMQFESLQASGNNATLNLESNELTVRGVDKIHIMDSLNVFIIPESKTVILKDNRNFKFDGRINTANFQFEGKNFEFHYDSFLVHMPEIDQIKLQAVNPNEKDPRDKKKARVLGNELRYSSGTLFINKPDNKSGRKNFPEYPVFHANSGATVLFNKQEIAGGAMDTTIRFKIPPFVVDSLASDDPQTIGFEGEFESGGIFPNFKTKLVVMPDFSLGFEYTAPEEGFQLYEGKGKYFNKITMDNRGLTGDGRIEFLNTTCFSPTFYFFKDSVLTIGTNAETKPGTNPLLAQDVTFPDFVVNDYEMNWKPRKDSMYLTNHSSPFQFYKNTATLNGVANITEHGMFGSGVLETRGSVSASARFHFEETRYGGRHTTFTVKSDNPSKPALRSTDSKLEFDLEKGEATFGPEIAGFASTEFPYLKYRTSIEKGVWDLDEKKVVMSKPEGSDISTSYFYSTHPTQDSLVFNASAGIYDMTSMSLNIEGVPFIKVMDGKVFPDSNKVVIKENADMQTLLNAKAQFDSSNAYHQLYDGTFQVKGRFKLKGEATYSYTNPSGDNYSFKFKNYTFSEKTTPKSKKKGEETAETDVQALLEESKETQLSSEDIEDSVSTDSTPKNKKKEKKKKEKDLVAIDTIANPRNLHQPLVAEEPTNRHTVAVGLIYPEDSIELSKKIFYKGKATMYSDIKPLFFDGFVKLDLKGALSYSQWLAYKNDGDTTDVKIMLEDPKADNGNLLTTGIHLTKDFELYTTFISEKDRPEDFDIFTSKGVLKFTSHPDSAVFKVATPQKFLKPVMTYGNLFNYDDNNSVITYQGKFNYIEENKGLELLASGSGEALLDSGFYEFNNLLAFKFNKLHKSIPEAIAANLKTVTDILPPDSAEYADISFEEAEIRKNDLYSKVCSAAGEKALETMMTKTQLLCEVSKDFGDAIVISDVDLKWSNKYKAWHSTGKLKISNVHGQTIDRIVNGYIEIKKTLGGDFVTLLIEPNEYNWYYFTYDNNRLAITSSNDEVNAVLAKKSKGEMPTRDKLYYVQADLMEKENFLRLFKERYLGLTQESFTPKREIKETDVPLEELPEEKEEEYIEEEPQPEGADQEPVKKNNEGTVIEEPELNRDEKHHDVEQKRQLQQDQQKMKDLFK